MKILAFVDLHSDVRELNKLIEKSKSVDVIICAGDISVFGHNLRYFLNRFSKIKKPFLIIPGNHETPQELRALSKGKNNIVLLHNSSYRLNNVLFIGHGTGGFSVKDEGFLIVKKKLHSFIKNTDKIIFVTHAPPYKTKIDLVNSQHVGSKAIRDFIIREKPLYHISGHIHETENKKDKLNKTVLLNPGYKGVVIDLG